MYQVGIQFSCLCVHIFIQYDCIITCSVYYIHTTYVHAHTQKDREDQNTFPTCKSAWQSEQFLEYLKLVRHTAGRSMCTNLPKSSQGKEWETGDL